MLAPINESVMITEIALNDFLPIFISSSLVLVFGAAYAIVFTFVKLGVLKNWMMLLAYLAWVATAYCLWLMGSLMHVGEFTQKALTVTMIGYLFLPHAIFYMVDKVHQENEH